MLNRLMDQLMLFVWIGKINKIQKVIYFMDIHENINYQSER